MLDIYQLKSYTLSTINSAVLLKVVEDVCLNILTFLLVFRKSEISQSLEVQEKLSLLVSWLMN